MPKLPPLVLVPACQPIDPACDRALIQLQEKGYHVWRYLEGNSLDDGRSQIATDALVQGYQELIWINPNIIFEPEDVEQLYSHHLPIVCGLYPKVGTREFDCLFLQHSQEIPFGKSGGLHEVQYCGFGFVYTKAEVYEAIKKKGMPVCNQRYGRPFVPFFASRAVQDGEYALHLNESFSFCDRARTAGFSIMADTTIRLYQVGPYRYGWEDVVQPPERQKDFRYTIQPTHTLRPAPTPKPAAERSIRPSAQPLAPGFPRFKAYTFSYEKNRANLEKTVANFQQSDWGEPIEVFMQPADWPPGKDSASRNYKRIMEHALTSGCDFAVILEDDVRVGKHFRHNLSQISLLQRDQCDYFSLFMPDLIANPWERQEPHLGYRLAKPMYAGPNRLWERSRIWGSQGYVLSRRFLLAAMARWDQLKAGQDSRVITICAELKLPMWYSCPGLIQHVPDVSAFGTPITYAADFDEQFRFERGPGWEPPEAVPGWLTHEEGQLLWQISHGKRVLELGTHRGRSTVCIAQSASHVTSIDLINQQESREWLQRYNLAQKVTLLHGDVAQMVPRTEGMFDVIFIDTEHDADSVQRDIQLALPRLAPDGFLAFHDYPDPAHPAVRQVVDAHVRKLCWHRHAQAGYLGVFQLR